MSLLLVLLLIHVIEIITIISILAICAGSFRGFVLLPQNNSYFLDITLPYCLQNVLLDGIFYSSANLGRARPLSTVSVAEIILTSAHYDSRYDL